MNPTVAKWLEEIAAAKAKAQGKATLSLVQQQVSDTGGEEGGGSTTTGSSTSPSLSSSSSTLTGTDQDSVSMTQPTKIKQGMKSISSCSLSPYGIIASFNLFTRKKQVRLVLPPEPIKPGPGECCGNDCVPCVNTIYWEDMQEYKRVVEKLRGEYEKARGEVEEEAGGGEEGEKEEDGEHGEGMVEDDFEGLSPRSYRRFRVLESRFVNGKSLRLVCDLPYPVVAFGSRSGTRSTVAESTTMTTFHVLIRFKNEMGQFVTKAFTPVEEEDHHSPNPCGVDIKDRKSHLVLWVKLYPSPHFTSDAFRALHVAVTTAAEAVKGGLVEKGVEEEDGAWVYMRGPIQTGFQYRTPSLLSSSSLQLATPTTLSPAAPTPPLLPFPALPVASPPSLPPNPPPPPSRVIMFAAGSGITPMLQVLRHHFRLPIQERVQSLDLVYCNRTRDDIWLWKDIKDLVLLHHPPSPLATADKKMEATETSGAAGAMGVSGAIEELTMAAATRISVSPSLPTNHHHHPVRIHHILSCRSSSMEENDPKEILNPYESVSFGSRITLEMIRQTFEGRGLFLPMSQKNRLQILICGPPLFNRDIQEMLALLGFRNHTTLLPCSSLSSCEIVTLE